MKYVKMLGLLAVAAAALMAFAGPASASTLTSPKGTPMAVPSTIEATSTKTELHGSWSTIACEHSVVKGTLTENQTKNGKNAFGHITTMHFDKCNYTVTDPAPEKLGTLEIDKEGNVYSSGTEIAVHTSVGECVFTTNKTKVGTLTEGSGAVLDIGSASIPRTGGSFFCGSGGVWTGSYTVTNPTYLEVH
jgi:hypothetical protein